MWMGYASFGVGYDDNVALISDSEVLDLSGREDGFAEAQVAVSTSLLPWRFDASLVTIDYFELNRFDQFGIQGGARYRFAYDGWSNDVALQSAYSTLDGQGFESRAFVTVRGRRSLRLDWDFTARYRFSHIEGLNEFDGVGGRQHEALVELAHSIDQWDLTVGYELELSDHDDETLSAKRHQLHASLARELSSDWSIEAESAVLRTSYDEANDDETQIEMAFAVARSLNATWRIIGRYTYADNDADVPEFNYSRNRIMILLEAIL
jgi:hypothetical protein